MHRKSIIIFFSFFLLATNHIDRSEYLKNISRYSKLIDRYSAQYNVDPLLVEAMIAKESSGVPDVAGIDANKKGWSYGLMQVKYSTAYGLGFRGSLSKLREPATNIKYGTKYIAQCIEWAKNDWRLALDYYNRGIGQAIKHPYSGKWEDHPYVGFVIEYMYGD